MAQDRTQPPSTDTPDEVTASQRDRAYERIRRLLILQQVTEGERLRESEWAERVGVNRTALREAFARLEAEGLIVRGPKTGYFLPVLTEEAIHEIIEVRVMLEGGAIDRIIAKGLNTARHLKGMKEACDQLERLVREEYHLGVAEADRRFHETIVQVAGNKRLTALYNRAPLPIIHPIVVSGKQWALTVQRTLEEHRAILAAMLEGDAEAARRCLRVHLLDRHMIPLCAV